MEEWAWRLGMLILAAVPAIVGGGIVWQLFEQWTPVILWEVVLLFLLSWLLAKGQSRRSGHGV
jgi:1,4-dihydroxy-2-naphthoate octaprenyltransferase